MCESVTLFNKLTQKVWIVNEKKFKTVVSNWLKSEAFIQLIEYLNFDTRNLEF